MVYRTDRLVWGAVLFRTTNPEVIEGAIVRRSERLHWTSEAAKEEVLGWVRELAQTNPTGEIEWRSAEDVMIGRFANDQSCCCDTINVASAGYATPYEMNQAETRRVGSLWPSLSCADGKSPPQTGSHA